MRSFSMKTTRVVYSAVLLMSVFLFTVHAGQDAVIIPHSTDLLITGAPLFTGWPETDSFMTTGLTIVAPSEKASRKKPVVVVVLVDISQSMEGEPLAAVKNSIRTLTTALHEGDMLGIVAFSTYARDIFPIQIINAASRTNAQNAVSSLGDEERRNTMEGLNRAISLFERFRGQDAAGRYLFLITNGNPDKGVTDYTAILDETQKLAVQSDIKISTFGLRYSDRRGDDFDEDMLYAMAENSGGRYYFAENSADMQLKMSSEVNRICNASARNVKVEIVPPGQKSKISNTEGGKLVEGNTILIGDMSPSEMRLVIFDLEGRPKRQTDCEIRAVYLEPDGQTEREARTYIDLQLISGNPRLNPEIAPRIITWDLQASLAETIPFISENRNEYIAVFRDKIKELENENVILDSDYIRGALAYYQKFERILSNTTTDISLIRKIIKYRTQQMLFGE